VKERRGTHWARASTDDAVQGQSIRDAREAERSLGIGGRLANRIGLLVAIEGGSRRVGDVRWSTVGKGVDHGLNL